MAGPYQQPPDPPPPPAPPGYGQPPYPAPAGYAPQYGYGVPYRVVPAGPAAGLAYAGVWIRFVAYVMDAPILDIPLYGLPFAIFGAHLWAVHCSHDAGLNF